MKNDESKLTCGSVIKFAREEKGMTINDLAFEISKNKENVKEYEKKITNWEKDKDYPDMNEIYLLANVIGINPTDLIILRDRHRKTLSKKDKVKKYRKINVDEIKEYLYYIAVFLGRFVIFIGIIAFGRFVIFIGIIAFAVTYAKLVKVSVNGSNGAEGFDRQVGNVVTDYLNSLNETDDNVTNNIIN